MRALLLFLAVAGLALAQISGLATTGNGAAVYFSNNTPLQDSNQPAQGRIYKIDSTGLHLLLDMPNVTQPGNVLGRTFTNYYDLTQPEVSRDSSILAFTGRRTCTGNNSCISVPTLQTTVIGLASGAAAFTGSGRLSGNGRYLFLFRDGTLVPRVTIVDLQTGQVQSTNLFADGPLGYGRVIADDGTAVWSEGEGFVLLRGTTATQVSHVPDGIQGAVIDSAARVVVYSLSHPSSGSNELHVYQTANQEDAVLAAAGWNSAPYVSADSSRVMFLSTASGSQQVWTVNTDGSGLNQVTNDATSVLSAAMSDDGNTAWFSSGSGRLFELNLNTGFATEELGRTQQLFTGTPVVPGSALTIQGAGLSDEVVMAQSFPLPFELGGVRVAIGGIAAPLLSVSATTVIAQVPWEVPAADFPLYGTVGVEVTTSSPSFSPFAAQTAVTATSLLAIANFVTTDPFDTLVIHEAWDGLVTPANPARPNEIVHLYGTGFGAVDSPPATGMPSPADPPAHTTVPVTCTYVAADKQTLVEMPVLFSGLAPGLVGYYQLDVRLPALLTIPTMGFQCSGEGPNGNFYAKFPAAQYFN